MYRKITLVLSLLMIMNASIFGQESYRLDPAYPVHDLQSNLLVVTDSAGVLTPERVRSDATLDFVPAAALPRRLAIGVPHWGKLSLCLADTLEGWALHLEDPFIGGPAWGKSNGKVDVYAYGEDGLIFHRKTGVEYPADEREPAAHWVLNQVRLDGLPSATDVTLVIRVEGNGLGYPPYFNLSARSAARAYYHQIYQFHDAFNVFMFGVAFIMFLYHFLQYVYLRERIFLWFSAWLLFCALTHGMTIGLFIGAFTQYRFSFWLVVANSIFYLFWFFGREFIQSKTRYPRLDRIILAMCFLLMGEIALHAVYVVLFDARPVLTNIGWHYVILNVFAVLSCGFAISLAWRKDPFARYFGLGALVGSLFFVVGVLWSMGFVRPSIDPFATGMFLQIVIFSFGIAYRRRILSEQVQYEKLQAQRADAEMTRMRDLDEVKTRFFANISHEFRTPLTLIDGPLRQAEPMSGEAGALKLRQADYRMIMNNTERLHRLVDQLLELSRLENGRVHLTLRRGGVVAYARSLLAAFESMAERQNVSLNVNFSVDRPDAYYDRDKLEKIITNLVSNAFKYTPSGGAVMVAVEADEAHLCLEVTDTGRGIAKENVKHIFERFYRIEGLTQGADAYLTKPFDRRELLLKIRNLLEARERFWQHLKNRDMFLTDQLKIDSLDDRFLQDVYASIKDNLDNELYGVEDLVRAIGFSRSQLHRKLKALSGRSANQLIVEIRMNEAHRLLRGGAGSVSEVAYAVGYANLSYFTKSFKQKFGVLPSKVERVSYTPRGHKR